MLRVNTLKTSRQKVLGTLAKAGLTARPARFSATGVELHPDHEHYPLFENEKRAGLKYGDMRLVGLNISRIWRRSVLREQHRRRQATLPPLPPQSPPGEQAKGK
jgi:hypothetical protein